MMHYGSVPFDMNTARWGYPTTENGFCLTPNVCRGRSRGTVRLRSRDYRDRARVDPRYFTDPEGHDERVMAYGMRLARKIVSQSPMAEWAGAELAPGPDAQTDDELIDYMHKTHNTVYHPACTAHMGPDSDPLAVVDPRLRVRGVRALRIADGSILPFLPAINPCITTMMIGEKCADMIKEDAQRRAAQQPRSRAERLTDERRGAAGGHPLPAGAPAVRRRSMPDDGRARRGGRRGRVPSRRDDDLLAGRRAGRAPAGRAQRRGRDRPRRPRARPARRGRAVRPRLDAVGPADRVRGARGRGHALLPDRAPRSRGSCCRVRRDCGSSRARCSSTSSRRAAAPVATRARRRSDPQPVGSLIRGDPVVCAPETSIREAARADDRGRRDARSSSSSATARSGSSPTAICARAWSPTGSPVDAPVSAAMSAPAYTCAPGPPRRRGAARDARPRLPPLPGGLGDRGDPRGRRGPRPGRRRRRARRSSCASGSPARADRRRADRPPRPSCGRW